MTAVADQQQITDEYRRQQAALSAMVVRDVMALWMHAWDPDRPESWRAVLGPLRSLVATRSVASAGLAVSYYRRARHTAGAPGVFDPGFPPSPPAELVGVTAGVTGPGTYSRSTRAGRQPEQATRNAAVELAGAMTRIVNNTGRQTIVDAVEADEDAVGWMRITDADPCAWCAMMASRGAVFKNAGTAGRGKNTRFTGEGQFKWHNHCGCTAAPVWDHDDQRLDHADVLYEQWVRETQGNSGKDAVNAWRRYWESRDGPPVDRRADTN